MAKITYTDKVALNENASIPDINKVKADDMNEIKSVVNTNSQISSNNFGLGTNTWTSSATYSIGDIAVYNSNTYKNLTGTNTTTTPDQDNTNWEVMPLIVDEKSDSTKNAYSCDYVNKTLVETYSTSEVKTNKVWIDGKPIYRKVLQYTYSTTETHQESLSSLNIDTITSYNWNCLVNNTYIINAYDFQDKSAKCNLFFDKNKIYMVNGTSWTSTKFTLILEYTKTTD